MNKKGDRGVGIRFVRVLKGLANLIQKLRDKVKKNEYLKQSKEIHHCDVEGVYDVSVKVGWGDNGKNGVQEEPCGNCRKDTKPEETVFQEIREPLVDVFEEKDHSLVVLEMPGVNTTDVNLSVKDDLLTIYAEIRDKKYYKEILLPLSYPPEKIRMSCNNGILEIKCVT